MSLTWDLQYKTSQNAVTVDDLLKKHLNVRETQPFEIWPRNLPISGYWLRTAVHDVRLFVRPQFSTSQLLSSQFHNINMLLYSITIPLGSIRSDVTLLLSRLIMHHSGPR